MCFTLQVAQGAGTNTTAAATTNTTKSAGEGTAAFTLLLPLALGASLLHGWS